MSADDHTERYGRHADPVATDGPEWDSSDPDAAPAGDDGSGPTPPRQHRVLRRVLISVGVLAVVLGLLIGGGLWFVTERYAGNINRAQNVFSGLGKRPAPASPAKSETSAPVTFLLMGSDTRAHPTSGSTPSGRSDAIIIARLSGDRQHAQFISIPRDSWVNVPGYGTHKINASYSYGGPNLLIKTVEQLTGVRIDHFVAIDFDGINQVTDDLGGVDVNVAQTTTNTYTDGSGKTYTFHAGINHLTGATARWYLGQRYGLPGSDFDRERRQQQYLKAVFTKLFSSGTLTDPTKLDSSLRSLTGAVTVDSSLSDTELLSLAYSARQLRPENLQFFTAPVLGTGMEGVASVVYLDPVNDQRMWNYLNTDSLGQNAGEFAKQALPAVPN